MLLALAIGCTGGKTTDPDDPSLVLWSSHHDTTTVVTTDTDPPPTTDTDPGTTPPTTPTDSGYTLPTGLYGTAPATNLPVPEFYEVVANDGTPRSSADLIGHPTILWFYPAALTGG